MRLGDEDGNQPTATDEVDWLTVTEVSRTAGAERLDGVEEVINEIQVEETGGIGAFISDVIIEKSIQSDYLFDKVIDSENFRVRRTLQIGIDQKAAVRPRWYAGLAEKTGWSDAPGQKRQSEEKLPAVFHDRKIFSKTAHFSAFDNIDISFHQGISGITLCLWRH